MFAKIFIGLTVVLFVAAIVAAIVAMWKPKDGDSVAERLCFRLSLSGMGVAFIAAIFYSLGI